MRTILAILCVLSSAQTLGQSHNIPELPYQSQKDRFSFAQLYVSLDMSQYAVDSLAMDGESINSSVNIPSISIGGLHFWGVADFYVTLPVGVEQKVDGQYYQFSPGIETGF